MHIQALRIFYDVARTRSFSRGASANQPPREDRAARHVALGDGLHDRAERTRLPILGCTPLPCGKQRGEKADRGRRDRQPARDARRECAQ